MRTTWVREAVLILDIEKSSGLTAKHGNHRAHEIKEGLKRVVRPAAQQFGASFVKFTGDGYFVTFPRETAAVEAAVAILQNLPERVREIAPEAEVHCRLGIAFGELTVVDGTDRQGAAASRAARLEAADPQKFHQDPEGVTREEDLSGAATHYEAAATLYDTIGLHNDARQVREEAKRK